MVAAVKQNAGLTLILALQEPAHGASATIETRAAADVDQRNCVTLADGREQ